jgi:hypothetical protein
LQLYTLIKINISLTNQNAASLPNVHTCNNVRVPGGIARGENGIRYLPGVVDISFSFLPPYFIRIVHI